ITTEPEGNETFFDNFKNSVNLNLCLVSNVTHLNPYDLELTKSLGVGPHITSNSIPLLSNF
ncbi:hypothetical protein NLR04_24350, partial [Escherichia coli]|nr:hypothetical protein [Escherichia coli]